jgi:hypothetical protein
MKQAMSDFKFNLCTKIYKIMYKLSTSLLDNVTVKRRDLVNF